MNLKNLTPEQLSLHLSHGDWVAMKDKIGNWKVFMYETQDGYFQGTSKRDHIEQCLKSGLIPNTYSSVEIAEDFTEYKIIKRPPVFMKAGDKCQIIDSPELRALVEKNYWHQKKEMIGQKGLEIEASGKYHYSIYNKDKSYWHPFPYWAVARDFSEEVEELTMEEVCKLLGREIKIKK